ncbi:hypothetical protein HY994_06355 [Candidatus Micrarchaeota archaeon]|nr:hypothetical protein [Candidatus Micrarchaeota archaeon]
MRLSVLWFDASSLSRILDIRAMVGLFLAIVLAYALMSPDFSTPDTLVFRFALSALGMAAVLALSYASVRALGSKISPPWFFTPVLQVLCVSLWVCLAVRVLSLAVDFAIGSHLVAQVVFSLTPFYAFALFGWAVDHSSQIQDRRALASGCAAAFLFAFFSLAFEFFAR